MSQFCFRQKRIINFKLPKGYDQAKIQIGIPVTKNENKKINLLNVGDIVLPSGKFGSVCKKNAYGYSYTDKSQPKQRRYVCTN